MSMTKIKVTVEDCYCIREDILIAIMLIYIFINILLTYSG